MNTDVIIVGAGPAGTATAMFLANYGYEVMLIDKQEFPRPKICGDVIVPATTNLINELGIIKQFDKLEKKHINKFKIVSPSGNIWQNSLSTKPGFESLSIITRNLFDNFLLTETIKKGVQFKKAKATGLLHWDDQIVGIQALMDNKPIELKAKIVIGADGVGSTIKRLLGVPSPNDKQTIIALRAYSDSIQFDPGMVEGYFYNDILPGYVWIFPVNNRTVNIGLGMRLDYYRRQNKNLKQILDGFLQSRFISDRIKSTIKFDKMGGHLLPSTFTNKNNRVFSGAILIGDAGGWVDPLSGGGIYNAMISGKNAAEVIHKAFQKNDFSRKVLYEYEEKCTKNLRPELYRNLTILKIFLALPYSCLDKFVRYANNSKLFNIVLNKLFKDLDFK